MPGVLSDVLAWVVIVAFAAGTLLRGRNDRVGRIVTVAAWGGFALFWLQLVPHFAFVHKSYVEGILSIAAVPASLYTGLLLWRGRSSLFVLSRAVAAMGLIYLPFETIPAIMAFGISLPAPRGVLMEIVAAQTGMLVSAFGYEPAMIVGNQGYLNTFQFFDGNHELTVSVVLACTGLGSISIFAGLIAAVEAPLKRKLKAMAVAVPIIYGLNILRTTFITIASVSSICSGLFRRYCSYSAHQTHTWFHSLFLIGLSANCLRLSSSSESHILLFVNFPSYSP